LLITARSPITRKLRLIRIPEDRKVIRDLKILEMFMRLEQKARSN